MFLDAVIFVRIYDQFLIQKLRKAAFSEDNKKW
jgi:hypothetical protein